MPCCGRASSFGPEARVLAAQLINHPNIAGLPLRPHLVEEWLDQPYPHFAQGGVFGFHAPVGNVGMVETGHCVDIVISGFCVAGETGVKYINETLLSKDDRATATAAAKLSFDTPSMRSGLSLIMKDLAIPRYLGVDGPEAILKTMARPNPRIAFTQALCPIAVNGVWKADEVMAAIVESADLREFASQSLAQWYHWLQQHANQTTRLVLMGKRSFVSCNGDVSLRDRQRLHWRSAKGAELVRLLMMSRVVEDGVTIGETDQGDRSLYDWVKQAFKNRLFVVPHAAYYQVSRKDYLAKCRHRTVADG